ncbi:Vitamin B12-binding protein [Oligella sp. MSHR50489EDL]|uniref:ABC transporter substrate-binding protein n=1 Tax=Oligella sp. MSHR50489EDL TaxID=3139409 RepID=UPI003D817EB4
MKKIRSFVSRPKKPLLTAALSLLFTTSAGFGVTPVVAQSQIAQPAVTEASAPTLVHVFGQLPNTQVQRVFAAGVPAAVILSQLAPQQLIGWPRRMAKEQLELLPQSTRDLTVVGALAGRGSTVSMEQLVAFNTDMIVDIGDVNAHYLSMAKQVNQSTGIPYVLLSGRLEQSPQQYRELGRLLAQSERAEKLALAAEAILAEAKALREEAAGKGLKFYMARSADGLETGLRGSIHTEVLRTVGLYHVADELEGDRLAQVSMEQLLLWQPDIILTHSEAFLSSVYEDTTWRKIPAVQKRQVYLVPTLPYGWMDSPPGVNRLLGVLWLSNLIKKSPESEQVAKIKEFYELFYEVSLDEEQIRSFIGVPLKLSDD